MSEMIVQSLGHLMSAVSVADGKWLLLRTPFYIFAELTKFQIVTIKLRCSDAKKLIYSFLFQSGELDLL